METIKHTFETPKEASELLQSFIDVICAAKEAYRSGNKIEPHEYTKIGMEMMDVLKECTDYADITLELEDVDAKLDLGFVYSRKLVDALL